MSPSEFDKQILNRQWQILRSARLAGTTHHCARLGSALLPSDTGTLLRAMDLKRVHGEERESASSCLHVKPMCVMLPSGRGKSQQLGFRDLMAAGAHQNVSLLSSSFFATIPSLLRNCQPVPSPGSPEHLFHAGRRSRSITGPSYPWTSLHHAHRFLHEPGKSWEQKYRHPIRWPVGFTLSQRCILPSDRKASLDAVFQTRGTLQQWTSTCSGPFCGWGKMSMPSYDVALSLCDYHCYFHLERRTPRESWESSHRRKKHRLYSERPANASLCELYRQSACFSALLDSMPSVRE